MERMTGCKVCHTIGAGTAVSLGQSTSAGLVLGRKAQGWVLLARCVAVLAILFTARAIAQPAPSVITTGGPVRGLSTPNGGATFLGIPYAQPPIGPLRWRAPQPVKPWSATRDAISLASPCAQPATFWGTPRIVNEDCLYLNVWNSEWPVRTKKPVMVWVHGGANISGSGAGNASDGDSLAAHGVVLVSFNYRLAAFGFFAHPALSSEAQQSDAGYRGSGNYGLMDQIAALQWVKQNIARFGGDPGNVTIFGESAGGLDVSLLLTSPAARGLFRRAIVESSPMLAAFHGTPMTLIEAEKLGEETAGMLNIPPGSGAAAALRAASPGDIFDAADKVLYRHWDGVFDFYRLSPGLGVDIDGKVLPQSPLSLLRHGQELPVDLLIGSNSVEFSDGRPVDLSLSKLPATIEAQYGSLAARALPLYEITFPPQPAPIKPDPIYGFPGTRWLTDTIFRCPSQEVADLHSKNTQHKTYEYEFAVAAPGLPYAAHADEVAYVFGNLSSGPHKGYTVSDQAVSSTMERYWTNFAKTGDPNGPGLVQWPEHRASGGYIEFTAQAAVAHSGRLREKECELFDESLSDTKLLSLPKRFQPHEKATSY